MKNKPITEKIVACLLSFSTLKAAGQELWMQPDKFFYKRTENINIKFLLGKNFSGENWKGTRQDLEAVQLYFADVSDKHADESLGDDPGDSLQLAMIDEGTVMVTLTTKDSMMNVEATDFNQYLADHGLMQASEYRQQHGDTLKNGLGYFHHAMKTIFQVGKRYTGVYKQKTDLPLEIIPDDHPYTVDKDGHFKMTVFFMGNRLKNARVLLSHKVDEKVSQLELRTDDDGVVKIFLSPEGEWMVTCVQIIKLENDARAEWRSFESSLTWGYY